MAVDDAKENFPMMPSEEQVAETITMFDRFLAHLDGLGWGGVATHVSLGRERFIEAYAPLPADAHRVDSSC